MRLFRNLAWIAVLSLAIPVCGDEAEILMAPDDDGDDDDDHDSSDEHDYGSEENQGEATGGAGGLPMNAPDGGMMEMDPPATGDGTGGSSAEEAPREAAP